MNTFDSSRDAPADHPTLSSTMLAAVQQMDTVAWSRLVDTFGPVVYRWCRVSGVRSADAPDLVQEVFASVARGVARFQREKERGSFRSWLATITRNRVRDHFRRQADQEAAVGGTGAWQQMEQWPESLETTICPESARSALVRVALHRLEAEFEPFTWQAFWQTAVESKPASEVAETTGQSIASVYQAKSRVLKKLRQRLSELPQ